MAYIDREKVCENCNNKNYCEKEKCPVYKVSIADVVPKSEYDEKVIECAILGQECGKFKAENEKLQGDLEVWKQNRFNIFQRLECYEMARQEVAREIFEELETKAPWFCENQTAYEHFNEELAELKKKYTEEKK